MTEAAILQIINLALYAPELAMKIQRLLMVPNPTQADWDVLWAEWARTPTEILAAARARAGLSVSQITALPQLVCPVPEVVAPVAPVAPV